MTNTWGKTKTKTDKHKKVEKKEYLLNSTHLILRLYSNLIVF